MSISKIDPAGLDIGQIGGRRNWLINSDFQVSQRGDYTSATTIPTSSTYYLDRFKFRRNGVTGTFTHKLSQTLDNNDVVNTVRLDVTSTATGRVEILQLIEEVNWFKNKTITFSAQVKSNSTDARLVLNVDGVGGGTTASTAHTGGDGWELLTGTATLPSGVTRVSIYAGIQGTGTGDVSGVTSGDYVEISEIQVEEGSVATPFEHRSYGEELALCQRYYCKSYDQGSAPGTSTEIGACYTRYSSAVSNRPSYTPFPVTMRGAPTITLYSLNGDSGAVSDCQNTYSHNSSVDASIVGPQGTQGLAR